MSQYKISFLGAGKVAEALCMEFYDKGHLIDRIVSPGKINGPGLADRCSAEWSSVPEFEDDTDIIIASVPDHLLQSVLASVKCSEKTIVAHTAGSFGLDIFPELLRRRGLFYPLQTFSKGRRISFNQIPIFLEASDKRTEILLSDLAESVGCRTYVTDEAHRRLLHIAAVFVSNFTNYMLTSGKEISEKAGFSFDILVPLVRETVAKAIEAGPEESQTGPASRNDLNTIEKHLELLSFSPGLGKLYSEVTFAIINFYKELKKDE